VAAHRSAVAGLLAAVLGLAWLASWGDTPLWGYEVVARYPHDPQAFTQGLVFADDQLYESTGEYGASEVRRVELETGRVLAAHRLPIHYFGEGLAKVGDELYQLTWRERTCLVYSADGLTRRRHLRYSGEGWGLARHGAQLVMSNGTPVLSIRDPRDFAEVGQLTVRAAGSPVTRLNELELIGGHIWANVWRTPRIAVIGPQDGAVIAWLDLRELTGEQGPTAGVLNGIAYDAAGDRIFVTGKRWSWLYEIRVDDRAVEGS
jgi:glutaminyl-peptide cyclotransferase